MVSLTISKNEPFSNMIVSETESDKKMKIGDIPALVNFYWKKINLAFCSTELRRG